MKGNILLMEDFLKNYRSIDPNQMQKDFPAAYRALPQTCFDAAGVFNLENWGRQEYHRSKKRSENLTHITAKGDCVRSKSEVIIANAIRARGLVYRYEELTDIGGYMKAPDFKIIHPVIHRII